jgi:hypothetical protein
MFTSLVAWTSVWGDEEQGLCPSFLGAQAVQRRGERTGSGRYSTPGNLQEWHSGAQGQGLFVCEPVPDFSCRTPGFTLRLASSKGYKHKKCLLGTKELQNPRERWPQRELSVVFRRQPDIWLLNSLQWVVKEYLVKGAVYGVTDTEICLFCV